LTKRLKAKTKPRGNTSRDTKRQRRRKKQTGDEGTYLVKL
jgi:hypothetical protein